MKKSVIAIFFCMINALAIAQEPIPEVAVYKSDTKGEASIITKKALESFRNEYLKAKKHRAFAQSESGAWNWRENRTSKEHAMNSALIGCQANNKKSEANYPCIIIHVDDQWIKK